MEWLSREKQKVMISQQSSVGGYDKAKKANKPSDASAMIEMDVELDQIQFKDTSDFYNDVAGVMNKYEFRKTDCELCMLMA